MEYFAHRQKEFIYKYVVMYSDVDQFQHMSFANYLKLMSLASDALLLSCSDANFIKTNRLCVKHARMNFKRQTMAGEKILIKVNAAQIQMPYFSLLFTFVIEGSGDLVCLGRQAYAIFHNEVTQPLFALRDTLKTIELDEEHLIYKY